jgi:hypothetical protein
VLEIVLLGGAGVRVYPSFFLFVSCLLLVYLNIFK